MEKYARYSGEQLLAAVAAGSDSLAFQELYARYKVKAGGFIVRYVKSEEEAEDLVHDLFADLWDQKQRLSSVRDADAYFYVLSRNIALKALRKRSLKEFVGVDAAIEVTSNQNTDSRIAYTDSCRVVASAVESLPRQARLVYLMSRDEGLSHDDISSQLGISKHTVYNHIKKSLHQIRKYFEVHSPDTILTVIIWACWQF